MWRNANHYPLSVRILFKKAFLDFKLSPKYFFFVINKSVSTVKYSENFIVLDCTRTYSSACSAKCYFKISKLLFFKQKKEEKIVFLSNSFCSFTNNASTSETHFSSPNSTLHTANVPLPRQWKPQELVKPSWLDNFKWHMAQKVSFLFVQKTFRTVGLILHSTVEK